MATSSRGSRADSSAGAWATGIGMFAGAVLLMLGTFQAFEGLSAILNDKLYVAGIDYVYTFDLTVWGWIHLIVGAIAVITAVGIFFEQSWAWVVGIIIAVLSALLNFMFIPHYPVWALVVIAFDIAAVWALSTMIREQ